MFQYPLNKTCSRRQTFSIPSCRILLSVIKKTLFIVTNVIFGFTLKYSNLNYRDYKYLSANGDPWFLGFVSNVTVRYSNLVL